jgi:hypothetical protein
MTDTEFETLVDARRVAAGVLNGSQDPYLGCGLISTISSKLESPPKLQVFELLHHEVSGHEHVGIHKEDLLAEIIAACNALVNE